MDWRLLGQLKRVNFKRLEIQAVGFRKQLMMTAMGMEYKENRKTILKEKARILNRSKQWRHFH